MNNYRTCPCAAQQAAGQQRCHCPGGGGTDALPENPVVAMAYVPFQEDITVFDAAQALAQGTLFPVLCKPFGTNERCSRA